jgi:hypothetical protein
MTLDYTCNPSCILASFSRSNGHHTHNHSIWKIILCDQLQQNTNMVEAVPPSLAYQAPSTSTVNFRPLAITTTYHTNDLLNANATVHLLQNSTQLTSNEHSIGSGYSKRLEAQIQAAYHILQQAAASAPSKTSITIDNIEYSIDTSQIPYLSSFVAFESRARPDATTFVHGPIPLFPVALKGIELGYRHCFRSLPPLSPNTIPSAKPTNSSASMYCTASLSMTSSQI